MRPISLLCALALAAAVPAAIYAQDGGSETLKVAAANKKAVAKKKKVAKPTGPPAKLLFGAVKTPAPMEARAIGFYAKGCLAGAKALPIDGPAWQAMRLSRNRNWGHPNLVALVEKLASEAKKNDGWPGLLVGDLSQPRGGPMVSSHASHQIGLDADIWFLAMPDRRLTEREREDLAAPSMVAEDGVTVDPKMWTEGHARVLKRAASYPNVERIFVHPAIKKALCDAHGKDENRAWLHKIRAYWGHHDHFHVRIACPSGGAGCESQPPLPGDDGCGKELTNWLALVKPKPKPETPPPPPAVAAKPAPPKPGLTMDQLPAECRAVLASGNETPVVASTPASAAAPQPTPAAATDKKPAPTK
jgi:penicillin-insensitive murein endopeptidase